MFSRKRNKRQKLLENYKKVKTGYFHFDLVARYFQNLQHEEARQVISDRTANDLDFEELFMYLDRTCSSIGQQYLYSQLRTIPKTQARSEELELYLEHVHKNPELKEHAIIELNKLNTPGAYYLQRLFQDKITTRPKWYWLIPVSSLLTIALLILFFVYPPALIILILLLSINIAVHFWNKQNVMSYSNVIPQLLTLLRVARNLSKNGLIIPQKEEALKKSVTSLKSVRKHALFFNWESQVADELKQAFDALLDLIKGSFLLEPILLFRLLKQIDAKQTDIKTLFDNVAQLDFAISVQSFRESLPYFCIPQFEADDKVFHSEKIYHPLIEKAKSNDFKTKYGKSILLSGSNMSGKTTFIRTVGVNALLAQTLNTACAEKLNICRFNIFSAIRISDDLMDGTSYYYEEVKTIKNLIEQSDTGQYNLFLLDEIFKGTNTVERISSGKAVLSYLGKNNNLVLCATHDLELIDYLKEDYDFYHFAENIENESLHFDYKLKEGGLSTTNAIRILELNQFPSAITDKAKSLALKIAESKKRAH